MLSHVYTLQTKFYTLSSNDINISPEQRVKYNLFLFFFVEFSRI